MARSLEISCGPQIVFDSNGTCGTPYEIVVTVDGQKNNASFTVSSILGDWYDYSVERCESPSFSPNSGYVKIIIKVPKNLLTINKIGLLKIEHNCAKIVKYVELKQTGVEYSLTATYDNGWQFKSMPDQLYEEKTVTISSNNGRGKWSVKEIQQYQVLSGDKFGDKTIEYVGKKEQDELMEQVRVPYDGVFNYRIDGNKLIVKSFGQIDLITKENKLGGALPHMRYFFVLEHSDVHNANKDELDNKEIEYRNRKLFIFDGDNGSGYEDGVTPSIDVPPIEGNSYKFMVNNSKSPIISVTKGGETKTITVISTKNGENLAYTAVLDGVSWCTINSDGTSLTVESNDGDYRECVIVYTQSETDDVIKLKVSQDAASEEFTFTVDGNSSNFTKETFGVSSAEYTPVVVSKKGNDDVEYTVYQQGTASWTKYSDGVITIEENNTTEERQAVYVFKQEGGSKKSPINVTIIQSAASESWVFTVSPSSKDANSSGETIPLTITSLHNGEFASFSVQDITEDWLYYDSSSKSIVVNPYSRDGKGSERSTTITFIQDRGNNVKVEQKVEINQKKQESVSSILKFVDEGVEKDEMTINYDGDGGTITVRIKSLDSNGLADPNIQITDGPKWFSLSDLTNDGYGYYITNVKCKQNTSSAREEKITFTNSSGDNIVLTVKQEGEVIVKHMITIKAGNNVQSDCGFILDVIKSVGGEVLPSGKIGEVSFSKPTDFKKFEVEDGEQYYIWYIDGEGDMPLKVTHKIATSISYEMSRTKDEYKKINSSDGEVVTINVVKEDTDNTIIIRSSGSTNASNGYGFTVLWRDEVVDEFYFDEPYQSITLKLTPNDNSYRMIYREGVGESIVEINSKTKSKVTKCYRSEGEVYLINNVDGEEITLTPNTSSKVYGCTARQSENGTNYYCLYGPNGEYDIVGTFRYPNTGNETTISQRIKLNSLTLPDSEYGYDYYVGKGAVINTICDERRGQPGYVDEPKITPVK